VPETGPRTASEARRTVTYVDLPRQQRIEEAVPWQVDEVDRPPEGITELPREIDLARAPNRQ
jgi:hypothetical protein